MTKQQLIAFMDWVESVIDLKINEELDRGTISSAKHEERMRDELLDLFDFGKGMK